MSLLTAENLTRQYGTRDIVRNASFRIDAGARIGLVGPNGSGKSTLLKLIAGLDSPTDGRLTPSRGLRVGYLPQEPPAPRGQTMHEAMLEVFADLQAAEDELHELSEKLGTADAKAVARYGQLQHDFELRGGYGYPRRIEAVLTGLGFSRSQWAQPLAELSGGQRTRAFLARLLLEEPDLLLLDEPTNHLDIESVEWLERWVQGFRGAIVVVSHDRYFLDRTTDHTWEISYAALEAYRGGYSQYIRKREERFVERMRAWEAQREYIEKTEEFIRIHLAGQRTKEAQGRRTRLERFLKTEAIPKPRRHEPIHLRLNPTQRSGDLVLRVEKLAVGYQADRPLLRIDRLEVARGQRVAIVGANGTGKTTLLRTILGKLPALGGAIRYGTNLTSGYLSQTQETLRQDSHVLAALREGVPFSVPEQQARDCLGRFLFSGDDIYKQVSTLSGGERSRVVLAQLSLLNANLLLLDEPTNHLDIPSTEMIQEVLQNFPGTVIVVSHDRYLVQAVATHLWIVQDGSVTVRAGGWDDYLQWRSRQAEQSAAASGPEDTGANGAPMPPAAKEDHRERRKRQNLLQRLQRRQVELEQQIHLTEAKLAGLSAAISTAGQTGDLDAVERLGLEYQQLDRRLAELMQEWEQTGEQLESA